MIALLTVGKCVLVAMLSLLLFGGTAVISTRSLRKIWPVIHPRRKLKVDSALLCESLFESTDDAIFIFNLEGQHIRVNRRAAQIFGYSEAELLVMSYRELVAPDEVDASQQVRQQLLQGVIFPVYERRFLHKDGREIICEVDASVVLNKQGEPAYIQSMVRDITWRKQAEERLLESEERYRLVVSNMADGVVLHGADGAIITCNPSAERILGLTLDQMKGRTSMDPRWRTIYEDGTPFHGDRHPAMITLHTGISISNIEMGVHKPDGTTTWIRVSSQGLFRPGETRPYNVVATFVDVTNHLEIEKNNLERAVERERARILSDFIRDASHDLRTPLAGIGTSLYLIRKNIDPLKRDQHVNTIEAQVQRLNSIIDELLLMARLDNRISLHFMPVNLNQIVSFVETGYQARAMEKGVALRLIPGDSLLLVPGDQNLLMIALRHLVENAINYTPSGGAISICATTHGDKVHISIEDTGEGISAADLPHIFQRFFRGDKARSVDTGGSGLGLSIAQKITELHCGELFVESTPGEGSRFTLQLPLYPV